MLRRTHGRLSTGPMCPSVGANQAGSRFDGSFAGSAGVSFRLIASGKIGVKKLTRLIRQRATERLASVAQSADAA
jgi:hypothetical protein